MKHIYAVKRGKGFMRSYDGKWLLFSQKWIAKMYGHKRKVVEVKLVEV